MLRSKMRGIRKIYFYCALQNRNIARLLLIRNTVADKDTRVLKLLRQVQKYHGASVMVEE